jgi:membrane-associated phospholipid phosphatase
MERSSPTLLAVLIALFALISSNAPAAAGGSASFALEWRTELAVGAPAFALYLWGEAATESPPGGDREQFGWFDEAWVRPYDKGLDRAADFTRAAGLAALPFLLDDAGGIPTIAVMYAESALLAEGARNVLKAAFLRPRPYLSFDDTPEDVAESDDRNLSFPSGHTSTAFMTASFATYVFSRGKTDSRGKWAFGIAAFSLAATTGALRVAAGMHHATDVLAGAAIGTFAGLSVPWLHEEFSGRTRLLIGADRIVAVFRY